MRQSKSLFQFVAGAWQFFQCCENLRIDRPDPWLNG
jgi:hypothetical protein